MTTGGMSQVQGSSAKSQAVGPPHALCLAGRRRSGGGLATVEEADALQDVLAAERAGAQGFGALLAAAHVAAGEEDHLRLGGGREEKGGLRREAEWRRCRRPCSPAPHKTSP